MRILWLTNVAPPEAAVAFNVAPLPFGSWIQAALHSAVSNPELSLTVAFPLKGPSRTRRVDGVTYVSFPPIGAGDDTVGAAALAALLAKSAPEAVHIFGTEFRHSQCMTRLCQANSVPYVIQIQGLSSTIGLHYLSGLPAHVSHGMSFRDLVKRDGLVQQARAYRAQGDAEMALLRQTPYVIGRTTWDRAVVTQANPSVRYFCIHETLRTSFYHERWSHQHATPGRIFVAQAHYPIKGLHFLLRAMPSILEAEPRAHIVVAGYPLKMDTLVGRLKETNYSRHVGRLITEFGLRKRVTFTGVLSESEIVRQYQMSSVFVSASTVENESNSLSEAKALGMPVVASYVGGVVDRVRHGESGFLYQHDAPYMLSHYVRRVLTEPDTARRLGRLARDEAMRLNNPLENATALRRAYQFMIDHG